MKKNVIKNVISLYGLSIAKIVFPLLTLPYLTRVLSVETYGVVSYVKSVMVYGQLIVDFGFLLSATKDIVSVRENHEKISKVAGEVFLAQFIVAILGFFIMLVLAFSLPILRENFIFFLLSYIPVFLSIFLFEYIFRGIEQMQIVTFWFALMRGTSTALTFVFVHNDLGIIWIPIIDTIGTLLAVILVIYQLKKRHVLIKRSSLRAGIRRLGESSVYFISQISTSAFGALITIFIGAFCSEADVAYWSLCSTLINAVQAMYNPIFTGIYPEMVKTKSINLIKRVMKIFTPILIVGCAFTIVCSKYVLLIIGGEKYVPATPLLISLTPLLGLSFPAMLLGWPTLGSIGKEKQVTITTIVAALVQTGGLLLLLPINQFGLVQVAIVRSVSELILLASRFYMTQKYKKCFSL